MPYRKDRLALTDADVADYRGGVSASKIAERHGYSAGTVIHALRRMGVETRGLSESQKTIPGRPPTVLAEKFVTMYRDGMSAAKVAEAAGLHPATVRKALKRQGVKYRKKSEPNTQSGERFGRLTTIEPLGVGPRGGVKEWRCRCDCGTETTVGAATLRHGHTKSCGCSKLTDNPISPGDPFGRWTAVEPAKLGQHGAVKRWLCRCDCGTERSIDATELRRGKVNSCGCLRRGPQYRERKSCRVPIKMVGRAFGRLTVICWSCPKWYGKYGWVCRCECGNVGVYKGHALRSGSIVSCGCRNLDTNVQPGDVYDSLTVLRQNGRTAYGRHAWLCRCECGGTITASSDGLTRGTTKSCGCHKGDGRSLRPDGYIEVWCNGRKWLEHRLMMTWKEGRPLKRHEEVHHIDNNKTNNHPDNLELWDHSQPPGGRVSDLTTWAKQYLARHQPEALVTRCEN
ncbi:HNH endonuclease [Alienimonas sp. DA493]|uniref:HNH endonuclease n=1 Tax=Alienimonas sp. DA493 TaxID=3373605 RepID=UPI0037549564